jgi:hypothetical protein
VILTLPPLARREGDHHLRRPEVQVSKCTRTISIDFLYVNPYRVEKCDVMCFLDCDTGLRSRACSTAAAPAPPSPPHASPPPRNCSWGPRIFSSVNPDETYSLAPDNIPGGSASHAQVNLLDDPYSAVDPDVAIQVRTTPSWARSRANFKLL